jgi:hypothetical protein
MSAPCRLFSQPSATPPPATSATPATPADTSSDDHEPINEHDHDLSEEEKEEEKIGPSGAIASFTVHNPHVKTVNLEFDEKYNGDIKKKT